MDLFKLPFRKANPYHDARGRFTTGPGGGAAPKSKKPKKTPQGVEGMASTARELDHLLITRYKQKTKSAATLLRGELKRLGTRVPAFKGGNRQLFREWVLGAVQLAGREKSLNAALNIGRQEELRVAHQRAKGEAAARTRTW